MMFGNTNTCMIFGGQCVMSLSGYVDRQQGQLFLVP